MCGIAGVIYADGLKVDNQLLTKMLNVMSYRGPNQVGFYTSENGSIGFGACRLSIVDVDNGSQPFFNERKTVSCVCNGEIYNYKEITSYLKNRGHKFYTECDIEVIPHLYEEYGKDFVKHLRGQFSFLLFDQEKQLFIGARDHFGICPLFYYSDKNKLILGSEIKSILEVPNVHKEVDLIGLDQLFTFPGLISPRTMFCNIESIKPGTMIIIEQGEACRIEKYWDLHYPEFSFVYKKRSEYEFIEELESLLNHSVKSCLQGDVPAGLYLSGGIDSSLVGVYMRKLIDKNIPLHTFSVEFDDKNISEVDYQKAMVEEIGSLHHSFKFSYDHMISYLKDVIYHAETPMADSFNVATFLLSKLVNQHGLRVVLAGQGADELFGGYVGYRFDAFRAKEANNVLDEEKYIRKKLWDDENFIYEKNYTTLRKEKLAIYNKIIPYNYDCLDHFVIDKNEIKNRHILHKRSYIDFKVRLADHLLSDHGDRMAMAHSVEVRYPFLNIDIINYVLNLPPELKLNNLQEKYILKQLGKEKLPKKIIKREKFGFTGPGSPAILKQNNEYINHILSYDTIKRQGYFDPEAVEKLKLQYMRPDFKLTVPYVQDLMITIITFGIFLDVFELRR